MEQEHAYHVWKIIEFFYKSLLAFRNIRSRYEAKLGAHAAGLGGGSEQLKLTHTALAGLFEFRRLEELRDRYLSILKEYCHQVFRGHETTDLFDRYVSDIFHEISILKEELYTVEHYAPVWAEAEAQREFESIVQEAGRMFPQKVNHVDFLFSRALERLEGLLSRYRDMKVVIRSLFLNRYDFVSECYPEGLIGFYRHMYPEIGPLEGYDRVGMSFLSGGFYAQAIQAFEEGIAYAESQGDRLTEPARRLLEAMRRQLSEARERAAGAQAQAVGAEQETEG